MKDLNKQTPTLIEVVNLAIESRLCELHTSLPAIVESYDSKTGLASVKPMLKKKFVNESAAVEMPIIQDVPVAFPRTQKSFVILPVAKGDIGHLQFSERSLDIWKELGGIQDPKDIRKHNLSDGVFYLGGYPSKQHVEGYVAESIHVKNESSEVVMLKDGDLKLLNAIGQFNLTKDGKIKIAGATGEIIDLLVQIVAALKTHSHATAVGPSGPPDTTADLIQLETLLDGLKV